MHVITAAWRILHPAIMGRKTIFETTDRQDFQRIAPDTDHFCEHESVDHFFFGTYIFGSHFFHTNWWIISFLELSETKMTQKCKFQKRNDPPIFVEKI